jgi:hypothetical protein
MLCFLALRPKITGYILLFQLFRWSSNVIVAARPSIRQLACARKFSSWDEPKSANEDFVIQIVSHDGMFLSVEPLIFYEVYVNSVFKYKELSGHELSSVEWSDHSNYNFFS